MVVSGTELEDEWDELTYKAEKLPSRHHDFFPDATTPKAARRTFLFCLICGRAAGTRFVGYKTLPNNARRTPT